jgi:hypothetical protein
MEEKTAAAPHRLVLVSDTFWFDRWSVALPAQFGELLTHHVWILQAFTELRKTGNFSDLMFVVTGKTGAKIRIPAHKACLRFLLAKQSLHNCFSCLLWRQLVLTMASPKIAALIKEGKSEVAAAAFIALLWAHRCAHMLLAQIEVNDVSPDTFQLMLDFIYTDKVRAS